MSPFNGVTAESPSHHQQVRHQPFKIDVAIAIAIGADLVPALLWRYGPKLIDPPTNVFITVVKARPVRVEAPVAVKPKAVVKKKKQPEQQWFW